MRRTLLLTVLLAFPAASGIAGAAVTRDPKDPQLHPRAADVTLASTLPVTGRDLPAGFRDKGPDTSADQPNPACLPNLHALVETAEVKGHNFQRLGSKGMALIGSEVDVFRSASEATRSATTMATPAAIACLKRTFRSEFAEQFGQDSVGDVRVTPSTLNTGSVTVHLWDFVATVRVNGKSIPLEIAIALYRRGRVIEALELSELGRGATVDEIAGVSHAVADRLRNVPAGAVR